MSLQTERENGPIDLAAIPTDVPSLCIPRVFPNISSERIEAVFRELNIGVVQRVDMVVRTSDKGETLKRVFIHMQWNNTENARKARERLLCGNEVKVIYEDPWFWKVSANRSTRSMDHGQSEQRNQNPRNEHQRNPNPRVQNPRNDARNSRPRSQDVRTLPRSSDNPIVVVVPPALTRSVSIHMPSTTLASPRSVTVSDDELENRQIPEQNFVPRSPSVGPDDDDDDEN